MATTAQIAANQANAKASTGPQTEEGKRAASRNSFRHGLASESTVIKGDDVEEFRTLHLELVTEHEPATITESMLVKNMAQHYWMSQRAIGLQNSTFDAPEDIDERSMALYLRYQATHDRAFDKALNQLLKLRAERRQEELHQQKLLLNEAKLRSLNARSEDIERETEIRNLIEAPIPGSERLSFTNMKAMLSTLPVGKTNPVDLGGLRA